MTQNRGFEIRQIQTPGFLNGEGILAAAGYGIEVLDGGARGGENLIVLGTGTYGTDEAYDQAASLRCWPGNKIIGTFDYLRLLPLAQNSTDIDTVTLKIQTARNAVFTNSDPVGMTRKRWLARGTQGVIAAGQAQLLYASNDLTTIVRDDYYTDERLTERGFFDGWVAGDAAFTIWIFAARSHDAISGQGTFRPIAAATATNRSAMAAVFGASHTAAYSYNFTWGSTGVTSTVNVPVPCPGTAFEIWVENNAAGGLTVEYAIGLRGSL